MGPPEVDYEQYLATVTAMLTAEGMDEAATLLKTRKFRVEETGYDNWNGGTTIYTVYLTVAPEVYARLRSRRASLEAQQCFIHEPRSNSHPPGRPWR
jgi:hypothetical protein